MDLRRPPVAAEEAEVADRAVDRAAVVEAVGRDEGREVEAADRAVDRGAVAEAVRRKLRSSKPPNRAEPRN